MLGTRGREVPDQVKQLSWEHFGGPRMSGYPRFVVHGPELERSEVTELFGGARAERLEDWLVLLRPEGLSDGEVASYRAAARAMVGVKDDGGSVVVVADGFSDEDFVAAVDRGLTRLLRDRSGRVRLVVPQRWAGPEWTARLTQRYAAIELTVSGDGRVAPAEWMPAAWRGVYADVVRPAAGVGFPGPGVSVSGAWRRSGGLFGGSGVVGCSGCGRGRFGRFST